MVTRAALSSKNSRVATGSTLGVGKKGRRCSAGVRKTPSKAVRVVTKAQLAVRQHALSGSVRCAQHPL